MRFIPIIFFLLVAILLVNITNMEDNPNFLPNMIGKNIPEFSAHELFSGESITQANLTAKPSILNIWASWCVACQAEHDVLLKMKEKNLPIYGLNSGDQTEAAKNYLNTHGNPFVQVISDPRREIQISFGATGSPETYVIDTDGKIYFHYRGNLTEEILNTQLLPIYEKLTAK